MITNVFLGSALLTLAAVASAQPNEGGAESKDSTAKAVESKIAIESRLEQRVQSVLTQVIGPGKSAVVINIELFSVEQIEAQQERQEKNERLALPGVPQKEDPTASPIRASLTMVKKLSATLMVDRSVPSEQVSIAKKMVAELLGISEARGDTLVVQNVSFFRETLKYPFLTPDFWRIVWIVLATLAIFIFLRYFLHPLVNVGREFVTVMRSRAEARNDEGDGPPTPGAATAAAAPVVVAGTAGPALANGAQKSEGGALFGFVHQHNLPMLIHLLRKSPPSAVAVAVNYLPPDLAAQVLAGLPPQVVAEVSAVLANVAEMEPNAIKQFESQIRAKIDYIIGGEEHLVAVLEGLSPDLQRSAIEQLDQKNPAVSKRLRSRLVTMEDFGAMDGPSLRSVIRQAGIPVVSQVLKADPGLAEVVFARLPASLAERLRNEVGMLAAAPPQAVEENRKKLLAAVKQLVRGGWITLNKGA